MAKRKKFEDHPELFIPPVEDKLWQTEGLFSDYFLRTHFRDNKTENKWWPKDEEVKSAWDYCRELYAKRKVALAKNNEAFTRQELLDKILQQLGFAWTDNLGIPNQDNEPDYVLYASEKEKEEAIDKDKASRYHAAIALLEAKKLNHPLSQISKHQQRYPHQQIRDYLQDAQVLPWGILTNGNEWRLYCREARPKDFFGLDFELAIKSLEDFKVFIALFSPAAFRRDEQGKCRLDDIRERALSSQSELEENLRKRVFIILADLANGFFSRSENLIPDTEESLKSLYVNCLIYLYRLLFILYAEGRNLLPVQSESRKYYKNLSLARLKSSLRNFADYEDQFLTTLGDSIVNLFNLIDGSNERMNQVYNVPQYNGGLFNLNDHKLLEKWKIADADLANVLRGLMFNPPPDRKNPNLPLQTVDYSDLRVQHLGSIYEGLLEHHLVRNGQAKLELKTDKAERKATGTYYTPDYIVKYIVEQTVKPLLEEIDNSEPVKSADPNHPNDEYAEAVLALNICDPAMGSGHFLVEATIYLADQIVTHPTTRQHTEKAKDEEEIAYWRRRVVESCIYGVDLNPLAVELAKLSLWLTCISSNQPLNFLDHHLRVGNSLIGARLNQLAALPDVKGKNKSEKQEDLFFKADLQKEIAATIAGIAQLEEESSENVEEVKEKEQRWAEEILPLLAPYKHIADLWTGAFFGEMSDKQAYIETVRKSLKKPLKKYPEPERKFFHWELEFPAIFFSEDGTPKENPGFDAVVGNPPWGMLQPHNTELCLLDYFRAFYKTAAFKIDTFQLFLEKDLFWVRSNGRMGMIIPNTLFTNTYCKGLRQYLSLNSKIEYLVVTSEMVFPDATVHPGIIILSPNNNDSIDNNETNILVHESDERLEEVLFKGEYNHLYQKDLIAFDDSLWSIRLNQTNAVIVNKLINLSWRLGDKKLASINRGLITGDRGSFFSKKQIDSKWHPIVTGADIRRYEIYPSNEFILFEKPGRQAGGCWDREVHLKKGKILVKQIGRYPQASVDEHPYCLTGNLFAIILKDDRISPYYVTSILNSSLTKSIWSIVLSDFKDVFTELKGEWLESWPIRCIAFTTPTPVRTRLLKEAKRLYSDALSSSDFDELLTFTATQLSARPERSDVIHDLLAFLAERMIEMNKEKHDAARGFLVALKDFHSIDVHALKPKTLLNEFWKLETSDLFTHFNKNRKTLAAANVKLFDDDKNEIRASFEKAKSSLLPLDQQIALTDRLIDQIVYKLYGLTEEEIRLVEGEK